jgi:hypothetical protein
MSESSPAFVRVVNGGLEFLSANNNRGYLAHPIPDHRDAEIADLLGAVCEMTDHERQLIMVMIGNEGSSVLRCYAERMASLSVRTKDPAPAHRGMLALAMAWRSEVDTREIWVVMGALFDALTRCGADGRREFRELGAVFGEDIAREFATFADRPDLHRIAELMGYVDGDDSDGFRYMRTW